MQALDATYGLVRLANQHLIERGIIDRQHGRGTFLARDPQAAPRRSPHHQRLMLLYVNCVSKIMPPFVEHLTLDLQRVASLRGYELLISVWDTDTPREDPLPFGLEPLQVDGALIWGRPAAEHLEVLETLGLPAVVVETSRLPPEIPQICPDSYQVTYEITRSLLQAGYGPVWLDGNPAYTQHIAGLKRIAGYRDACLNHGETNIRLCDAQAHLLAEATETLLTADLSRAALIIHDWSAPLLPTALRMRSPHADQLLLVPASYRLINTPSLIGPSIMQWTQRYGVNLFSEPAVHGLIDRIEGVNDHFISQELHVRCKLLQDTTPPRMQARWFLHPCDEAAQHRHAQGLISAAFPGTADDSFQSANSLAQQ